MSVLMMRPSTGRGYSQQYAGWESGDELWAGTIPVRAAGQPLDVAAERSGAVEPVTSGFSSQLCHLLAE